jgi:hypothetical protein
VLAIELLAAVQATEFLRPEKTTAPLEALCRLVRGVVTRLEEVWKYYSSFVFLFFFRRTEVCICSFLGSRPLYGYRGGRAFNSRRKCHSRSRKGVFSFSFSIWYVANPNS